MTTTATSLDELREQHAPGERRTHAAPVTWAGGVRADTTDRSVRGHAAVFHRDSVWMGFTEQLAPGAFRDALLRADCDPFLLLGHESDAILARQSAGTLEVAEDVRGLAFRAAVVPTTLGDDVLTLVRTGHLTGCSFGFTVAEDDWSLRDGKPFRLITRIGRLYELTLTGIPAYPDTDVRERRAADNPTILSARARLVRARAHRPKEAPPVSTTPAPAPAAPAITVREQSPYGPERDRAHSWFRDLLTVQAYEAQRTAMIGRGLAYPTAEMLPRLPGISDRNDGGIAGARRRLMEARADQANSTSGTGGEFLPIAGVPVYIADRFATAARVKAAVAALLPHEPLPAAGERVQTGKVTSGASVGVQAAELDSPASASLTTALAEDLMATIAGQLDVTQQLIDRSNPDTWLAAELGAAYGERLEVQVLQGSGSSGELRGLLAAAGTARTFSTATPTVAQVLAELGALTAATETALGREIDTLVLHSRREEWLNTKAGYSLASAYPAEPTVSLGMPTTDGTGTDEDAALVLARDEVTLYSDAPSFRLHEQVLDGTLQVRAHVYGYAILLADRQPKAVGKSTGAGWATPTF